MLIAVDIGRIAVVLQLHDVALTASVVIKVPWMVIRMTSTVLQSGQSCVY